MTLFDVQAVCYTRGNNKPPLILNTWLLPFYFLIDEALFKIKVGLFIVFRAAKQSNQYSKTAF